MTKLAAGLPKGDGNGLDAIARELIDNPQSVQVVIALVDCKKTTTDNDTGDIEATARIRRIEAVTGDDKDLALEEDLREAFGGVDPQTGEIS